MRHVPLNSFIIRTPIHPLSWIKSVEFADLTANFYTAIYLSSKDFWFELTKIENLSVKQRNKLLASFLKFKLRSCTRSTPYATFAGITRGEMGDATSLIINEAHDHSQIISIDSDYIFSIIRSIFSTPEIRSQLLFHVNNSLYEVADSYRFIAQATKSVKSYNLAIVNKDEYLSAILNFTANGATIEDICTHLVSQMEVPRNEANEFIEDLIKAQILLPDSDPCVTGNSPFIAFLKNLTSNEHGASLLPFLQKIDTLSSVTNGGIDHYKDIENELRNLAPNVSLPEHALHVDMYLSSKAMMLHKELTDKIIKQVVELTVFTRKNRIDDLETFKTNFYTKYESSEVPISVALDVDIGIGYGNNTSVGDVGFVDDLIISSMDDDEKINFDFIQKFSLSKYNDFLSNKKEFIEITEEELSSFKSQLEKHILPESMYLIGSLFKGNEMTNGLDFSFHIHGIDGPSGANLLGRFASGNEQINDLVKEIIVKEEKEDSEHIYVEIVHLPEARLGNVLLRPVFRKYELPYVGKSGAPLESQIPVSDIMVSINNDEVVLRSKKHDKKIIPRLTTAHNYGNRCLPMYKFLCDLQHQNYSHAVLWDWGGLNSLKHLPRVVYRNLIVRRARWLIYEKDISTIPVDPQKYISYFSQLRAINRIPERIVYIEGDNELMLDLTVTDHLEILAYYIRKHKKIRIEEFLFTENNCVVNDINNEPYANEIILFLQKDTKGSSQMKLTVPVATNIERKFLPGSEWLFFKIYAGRKQLEKILFEVILPFINEVKFENLFEKFFYVRYKDDSSHLRVRFYNSDSEKQTMLQKRFMALLKYRVNSGLIDKVLLDTYSREFERYGENLIEESESLFYNDSMAVMKLIYLLQKDEDNKYRLLTALRGIDALLNDFNLGAEEKHLLLKNMQHDYFQEFGGKTDLQKQLNAKYRQNQADIFTFMDTKKDVKNNFFEFGTILKNRTKQNAPVIAEIEEKIGKQNTSKIFDLLPSYIHMFINRLVIDKQRKHELVIYHFLEKYYSSQIAIKKSRQ